MTPPLLPTLAAALVATAPSLVCQSWTQIATTVAPSGRAELCGTFDMTHGKTVVFGGRDRGGVGFPETWLYDGLSWTQASPATSPTGRMRARMTHDAARGVAVMFGGALDVPGATQLDDTWEWDGTTWSAAQTANRPTPRHSAGLAFDLGRNVTVLFGGLGATSTGFDDTWEYDGIDWVQRSPATVPPEREGPAMAFDPIRGITIMFGGFQPGTGVYLEDTWAWDGTDWTQVFTSHAPTGRKAHDMAFDYLTSTMVMHGGFHSGSLGDTWQFDGYDWVEIAGASGPTLSEHVLVYDLNRGVSVCFGGTSAAGFLAETWEYASAIVPTYGTFGRGCAGSGGTPTLVPAPGSVPALGAMLRVDVTGLPGLAGSTALGFDFASLRSPVDLGLIGMPGCVLEVPLGLTIPVAVSRGVAIWQIGMPTDASFVGTEFFNQAVTLDPSANALGVTLSNAGHGRIAR